MSPVSSKFSSKSGFTLVELLVVTATIAVLAGLLVPVLSRAQAQAKTAACVSNLRVCGSLILLYAGDHQNSFPPASYNNQSYVVALTAYLPASAALSNRNVFVSPAALQPCTTYGNKNFTYAVHNGLFGGTGENPVRLTNVTRPSQVIMMANGAQIPAYGNSCAYTFWNPWEMNQGDGYNAVTYLNKPIPATAATNVDNVAGEGYLRYVQRNNTAINALMVDGHVETIPMGKVLYRNVVYDQ